MSNAFKTQDDNFKGREHLGNLDVYRFTKKDFREIWRDNVDWIELAQEGKLTASFYGQSNNLGAGQQLHSQFHVTGTCVSSPVFRKFLF